MNKQIRNGNGVVEVQPMKYTKWCDSLWNTHQFSYTLAVGDYVISRKFSIGMTARSSDQAPSDVLYDAVSGAISRLEAQEIERVLDPASLEEELKLLVRRKIELEAKLPAIEQQVRSELISCEGGDDADEER